VLSLNAVVVLVPIVAPFRDTAYPTTPTSSVDGPHVRVTCELLGALACRLVGTLGGELSAVAAAWASFEDGPLLPAPSTALTR
jgi:hypothetical protein